MKQSIFTGYSTLYNMHTIVKQLLIYAGQTKVWLFLGDIGAGKTTLIKILCAELGVIDVVSSPTFALVHEYESSSGAVIYHIDAYRTDSSQSSVEWQSYLDMDAYCFIEWPTRLGAVALPPHIIIQFEVQPNGMRYIEAYLKS